MFLPRPLLNAQYCVELLLEIQVLFRQTASFPLTIAVFLGINLLPVIILKSPVSRGTSVYEKQYKRRIIRKLFFKLTTLCVIDIEL